MKFITAIWCFKFLHITYCHTPISLGIKPTISIMVTMHHYADDGPFYTSFRSNNFTTFLNVTPKS